MPNAALSADLSSLTFNNSFKALSQYNNLYPYSALKIGQQTRSSAFSSQVTAAINHMSSSAGPLHAQSSMVAEAIRHMPKTTSQLHVPNMITNSLNSQIQSITTYDMNLGTKLNNISNQLGLKHIEKTNSELMNLSKLLGTERINDIFDSLDKPFPEIEPSKPVQNIVQSGKNNISINDIDQYRQTSTSKVKQSMKDLTNQTIQCYQSLPESKKRLFGIVVGELSSYIINYMFTNLGTVGAIIFLLLLISPGPESDK